MAFYVPMLGNIMNALRRTGGTIVVGYFWFGLAWFLVKPHLPGSGRATGAVATAYRLSEALAKPGVVVVGTLAAYLVGLASAELLMPILRILPLPRDTRTIVVQRSGDDSASFSAESTSAYVANGLLPARLYGQPVRASYERVCAEARFLWVAPLPLIGLAVYLTATVSPVFGLAVPAGAGLMAIGWLRFRWAARLLSQEAWTTAAAEHVWMVEEWDRRAALIGAD